MTNNKSIEGIIEDRLIELFKHSGDVPAPFRYIPKTKISELAKSIASDLKKQYKVVARDRDGKTVNLVEEIMDKHDIERSIAMDKDSIREL